MNEVELREQIDAILEVGDMLLKPPDDLAEFIDKSAIKQSRIDQILILIKQAGYLPVEPVQLEELPPERICEIIAPYRGKLTDEDKKKPLFTLERDVSQATNAHNEAKGKLYRRRE